MTPDIDRRSFLKLTGSGVVLLSAGSTTTLADEDEMRAAAKAHVAAETGRNADDLSVVAESVAGYPTVGERYYHAKVRDDDGGVHRALLDGDGDAVARADVEEREAAAYEREYGALTPDLAERVEAADADEKLAVGVWHRGADRAAAKAAIGLDSLPNDASTKAKLTAEVTSRIQAQSEALASKLRAMDGVEVTEVGSGEPRVGARATPAAIDRLQRREDVVRVFDADYPAAETQLYESSHTHRSYGQRNGDFQADGYTFGVFGLNGYPKADYLNIGGSYQDFGSTTKDDHAHKVGLAAASTDDQLPGIAHEADVYCAMDPGSNLDAKMQWFDEQGVAAVNGSWAYLYSGRKMRELDFRFNQFVINRWLNVTFSAGNYGTDDEYITMTPAKGFNQVSVGAVDNEDTADWSDDSRSGYSCWKDPDSKNANPDYDDYPHDKPEVSAVGDPTEFPTYSGTTAGTSFSAPHAGGLATLLSKFSDDYSTIDFSYYPEVAKPVMMASATNTGDSGYDFQKMGAGTIVATNAEDVVANGWFESDLYDESNDSQTYTLYANESDSNVRVALCWFSDVTDSDFSDNSNAQSDLDLDLAIDDPDGNYVTGSYEWDRGFEWLEFDPSKTGDYTIEVSKFRWDSSDSSRWIGLAWFRE
jgi:hypothetical protein